MCKNLKNDNIKWLNPRDEIWGFHIHQEVEESDFSQSLYIQEQYKQFLNTHSVRTDVQAAFKPGYGPHMYYMWELRFERLGDSLFEGLGLAAAYLNLNRFNLTPYIHPLMHDLDNQSEEESLIEEAEKNQKHTIWFGKKIKQNQDFFYNPPRTKEDKIVDTRSICELSTTEIEKLRENAKHKNLDFLNPKNFDMGYQISIRFSNDQFLLAEKIFKHFIEYLNNQKCDYILDNSSEHSKTKGVLKITLCSKCAKPFYSLGLALGWLICNRNNLPISIQSFPLLPNIDTTNYKPFIIGEDDSAQLTLKTDKNLSFHRKSDETNH